MAFAGVLISSWAWKSAQQGWLARTVYRYQVLADVITYLGYFTCSYSLEVNFAQHNHFGGIVLL